MSSAAGDESRRGRMNWPGEANEHLNVHEAARQLGVSPRDVQFHIARGNFNRARRGEVDRLTFERHRRLVANDGTRPWKEENAWAAIALLSALPVPWVSTNQRLRLQRELEGMSATRLLTQTRHRTRVLTVDLTASHDRSLWQRATRLPVSEARESHAAAPSSVIPQQRYIPAAELGGHPPQRRRTGASRRGILRVTRISRALVLDIASSSRLLQSLDRLEWIDASEDVRRCADQTIVASALAEFADIPRRDRVVRTR